MKRDHRQYYSKYRLFNKSTSKIYVYITVIVYFGHLSMKLNNYISWKLVFLS